MSDFNIARKNMIQNQLMTNNITEENILNAFNIIPRELFLPIDKKPRAYLDENIEISSNRYLIEPRIISSIIKFSNITKEHQVLDLGCSTGYSSAILSMLSKKVYGVDNKGKLLDEASSNIKKLNIKNVKFIEKNPLDVIDKRIDIIFIFGGVELVPINLINCLKNNGGTLVTVLYKKNNIGNIHIIKKINGKISRHNYITAQIPILNEFKNRIPTITS